MLSDTEHEVKRLFRVCSASNIVASMVELNKPAESNKSGKPRRSREHVTIYNEDEYKKLKAEEPPITPSISPEDNAQFAASLRLSAEYAERARITSQRHNRIDAAQARKNI